MVIIIIIIHRGEVPFRVFNKNSRGDKNNPVDRRHGGEDVWHVYGIIFNLPQNENVLIRRS